MEMDAPKPYLARIWIGISLSALESGNTDHPEMV
jgi:hypothetical protein